jgi:prepilin-type processing-associated H-X9-DG protein
MAMVFGALTWIGFMVAVIGWGLLFSATPVIEILATLTGRSATSLSHLASIAECAIITGLGLAIVGALQTGFGALNHFFGAVLERTARAVPKPDVAEPHVKLPSYEVDKAVPLKREPAVRKQAKIVERGRLKNRAYVLFGDGSVEVETLLGLRRFASLGDANEFIG